MRISLYYGDEDYLLRREVRRLREAVIPPGMESLAHKKLNAPTLGETLEAVGAIGFNLGGATLIEIREFAFLNKAASATDEKQLAELMRLLEEPDEAKHILFVSAKINRTVKFAKWLSGHKTLLPDVQECKALAFWQTDDAVRRILEECRAQSVGIEPKAVSLLVEQMGVTIQPVMNEIEKLAVYAAGRAITAADVATLSNHNENTFRMLEDWVHDRHHARMFQTLEELLLRQNPIQLFALTQSWLGHLFQLRYWRNQGVSEANIAEMTKKHPFRIKKELQEFSNVPFERLDALRARALNLEWRAKTGDLSGRLAFEMLLAGGGP